MRQTHVTALAKAVAQNFLVAGFSSADLLTGQITLTDLPWQCPPLKAEDTLGGYPLEDYISAPTKVDPPQLYKFWLWGLEQMYASASRVTTVEGWRGLTQVLPGVSNGERALRFATPEGFPHHNDFAGHAFTLEVVYLFATSTNVASRLMSDANNFYVETMHGPVGILDGQIIGNDMWGESCAGMVDSMLASPRGYINTACRFDLLSKVRSVLHENAHLFDEFTGMDYALQTLAKLSQDRLCGELLSAVQQMLPESFETKRKIKITDEALEMLDAWVVNDRVKLGSMYEMLVPTVMTIGQFYARIFNLSKPVPAVLSEKTLTKIRANLEAKRAELMLGVSKRDRPSLERT